MPTKRTNGHGGKRAGSGRRLTAYDSPIRVTLLIPRKIWGDLVKVARLKNQKRNRLVVESLEKVANR